jgi:hypothetical protein
MRFGRRRPDPVKQQTTLYLEPTSDESVDALLNHLGRMALRTRRVHKLARGNADKGARSMGTNLSDGDPIAGSHRTS